jgi:RNA ligase
MRFDWDELRRIKGEGFLAIVPHPDAGAGLWLLNYTKRAQYGAAWDTYPILLDCRGTVVDAAGEVVAKPFRKFFNAGERPETALDRLATLGPPEVTHKLDGSMCVLYPYAGGYRFATRGSFRSEQATRATALWGERYTALGARLDPRLTYLFELVSPANRIVVRYDEEALILIGLVVTATGEELPYAALRAEAGRLGLPVVAEETPPEGGWADWRALLDARRDNFEGFVLFWPEDQLRVKIKLAEYVRLHRLVSGLSEHLVWEYLRDGADLETLRATLPEEFLPWLDGTVAALRGRHAALAAEVGRIVATIRAAGLDPASRADRKAVAAIVLREDDTIRPAAFRALDGKPYADLLWKAIEPEGVELVRVLEDS